MRCGQRFFIPQNDNEKVKIIEPEKREYGSPLPGFYKALYKYSWRTIFSFQSLPLLILIIFLATLKFYTFHANYAYSCRGITIFLPIGWIIALLVYGGLFYCFAEIVASTAFDVEALPEITFNGGLGYAAIVFQSLYSFILALIITLIPAIIFKNIFNAIGIKSDWAILPFIALAMFLFPMVVITLSITRDFMYLIRPDFFTPIVKGFRPYLFLSSLFLIAFYLHFESPIYKDVATSSPSVIYLNLFAAIAIEIQAVITMRAAGLFYRHFSCYFKW
ncbi:MAG: hypothetical protein ABFD79_14120 [Phycisphaerales bacterium]